MIEIPNGWNATQITLQFDLQNAAREVTALNKKLEKALLRVAELKSACKHEHVHANGDELWCDICGECIGR